MIEDFTLSTFKNRLQEKFRIVLEPSKSIEVELVKITDLGARPIDTQQGIKRERSFSIVFRAPMEPLLPQQIYRFEHREIGSFDLFIVPIGPDDCGMCYEAVFN